MAKRADFKRTYRFECKYHNYIKYIKILDGNAKTPDTYKEIRIQFDNGIYETEDEQIARALSDDIYIKEISNDS